MLKRGMLLCVSLMSLLLVVTPLSAGAQTGDQFPQVYVKDITLTKSDYAAGETVTGSFVIDNPSGRDITNVRYTVSLRGGYKDNGLASETYHAQTFGPVSISAGQQNKLVNFTYVLPQAFNTDTKLGLQIQAHLPSGIRLGWSDAFITVTGGVPSVAVTGTAVVVDGKSFPAEAGPTLYRTTKDAFARVILSNTTSEEITVTPKLTIHDRVVTGKALHVVSGVPLTVAAGSTATTEISLPYMDYTSGVYAGMVSFPDAQDITRAPNVEIRYIVGGSIVHIESVTAQKTVLSAGENYLVTVYYTGTPHDIADENRAVDATATLQMRIFNEHNNVVGRYSRDINFNEATQITVPMVADDSSKALRAEVQAVKGDIVLAAYEAPLSADYNQRAQEARVNSPLGNVWITIGIIIGLLILLIASLMAFKIWKNKMAMMLFVVLGIGTFFALAPHHASAYTITDTENVTCVDDYDPAWLAKNNNKPRHCNNGRNFVPQIEVINTPSLTMSPGQTFNFSGIISSTSCMNSPASLRYTVNFRGVQRVVNDQRYNTETFNAGQDHSYPVMQNQFSVGSFTTPSTPGVYRLTFRIDNFIGIGNVRPTSQGGDGVGGGMQGLRGAVEGYIDIVVVSPTPTVTISANPNPVNYNTAATLTWSSTNATTCIASNGWSGVKSTSGTQSTGNLTSTRTYTVTCTGAGGSSSRSVTVTVNSAPQVSVSLSANPTNVVEGGSTVLTWSASNASSCVGSGGWSGSKNTSGGSQTVQIGSSNTQFTISCTGADGTSRSDSVTVTVTQLPPTVSCRATDANGNTITSARVNNPIYWRATANNGVPPYTYSWSGSDGLSGSGNPQSKTYTSKGTKSAVVTVTGNNGISSPCTTSISIKEQPTFNEI